MNYEPFYFWKVEVVDEGEHTTLQCMVEAHDDNTYSWRILNMTTGEIMTHDGYDSGSHAKGACTKFIRNNFGRI